MSRGTPAVLRLQFAAGDGTKEVDVPSGSTLQDLQRTVKRAFPAMKNKACVNASPVPYIYGHAVQ